MANLKMKLKQREQSVVDTKRVLDFIIYVRLALYNLVWNPYDCSELGESLEEKRQLMIEEFKTDFEDVINNHTIESMCRVASSNIDKLYGCSDVLDGTSFTKEFEEILIKDFGLS